MCLQDFLHVEQEFVKANLILQIRARGWRDTLRGICLQVWCGVEVVADGDRMEAKQG